MDELKWEYCRHVYSTEYYSPSEIHGVYFFTEHGRTTVQITSLQASDRVWSILGRHGWEAYSAESCDTFYKRVINELRPIDDARAALEALSPSSAKSAPAVDNTSMQQQHSCAVLRPVKIFINALLSIF